MKKIILSSLILFSFAFIAKAQTASPNPNRMVLTFKDGTTQVFDLADLDYMELTHEAEEPAEPKVGDYFYSDGTWSDGGLISIDLDGCNAVWAAERPAPLADKTVIGIVAVTDPSRIATADKEAGYTHGYVIGLRNITDPQKSNYSSYPESVWFAEGTGNFAVTEVNGVCKLSSSCYNNIDGRTETNKMLAANAPQYYYYDIPLFYNGTAPAYPVAAPETTSGWFIPSIGQMWDCVANFCSGEVAAHLANLREKATDFTYYTEKTCSTSPLDQFMKAFDGVPDDAKDAMTIADGSTPYISLATSTRYDTESRLIFNLGMTGNGYFEGMAGWFNEESHGRPFLAF